MQWSDIIRQLFKEVIVPKAVFMEVVKGDKPEAKVLEKYLQEKVRVVDMHNFVYLDGNADAGETEAMSLYKQELADKLLIDDRRGRRIAKINGINTKGVFQHNSGEERVVILMNFLGSPNNVKLSRDQIVPDSR